MSVKTVDLLTVAGDLAFIVASVDGVQSVPIVGAHGSEVCLARLANMIKQFSGPPRFITSADFAWNPGANSSSSF